MIKFFKNKNGKDKKGIQLSVNFIVTITIAAILFGMGFLLFTKIFGHATTLSEDLDAKTQQEITNILNDGSRIAVPQKTIELYPGDEFMTGIGIYNIYQEERTFCLDFRVNPPDGVEVDYFNEITVEPLKKHISKILMKTQGTASGSYAVSLRIYKEECTGNEEDLYDGRVHNIYIDMK